MGSVSHYPASLLPQESGTEEAAADRPWKLDRHSGAERPGAWLSTGKDVIHPCLFPPLAFYLYLPMKDSEHSGPSICDPGQLAAVYFGLGVLS